MNNKVLIIGAGISGLASALMLERIGYAPVIFEKSDRFRNEGGGLTLWSNGTDALHFMDLLEETYQNSKIMKESALLTSSGKTLATILLEELATTYGTHTVGILRTKLHHLLANNLENTEMKLGYKLVELQENNEEVTARFENGHEETGAFLVGADGIHSSVRNHLFPNSVLRFSGYEAWRGTAPYTKSGFTFEAWGKGLRFGFVPVSSSIVYWFATRNTSENLLKVDVSKEELAHMYRRFAEPVSTVIKATPEKDITRKAIYDLKPLQNWSKGRMVLIGDAAHATTPNLGQGACLALEDSVILAKKLEQSTSISEAIKNFEKKRIKRAKFIVNSSWVYGKVTQIENTLMSHARNMLVKNGYSIQKNSNMMYRIIGHKV
ncbi:FAD-dependent monooxygenase [Halalkalibacter sp. APA_J-10(15)]|uniref:FAD-dependent monooxygenase n=1 Tax=Halalkalibacter sp. APA_J-10(15) TaxID=2933805 RepID=UPI001FF3E248|nr:FAD-dependent monooxygenase [Halalkalibacter sp. APA_J-10(15)]MCK0473448.1 FAD-dependent monooxygenase [Halalkalibacter sp. APA_J-10(15)]